MKNCVVAFTAPTLNSANKYVIRLESSNVFQKVEAYAQLQIDTLTGTIYRSVKGEFYLSPKGATNPGFRFYMASAGTWNANFWLGSSSAPTVGSYDFTLWSVNGNNLNSVSTQSLTSEGLLSFTISTAGFYFLTVNPQISSIDSTVNYPIALDFVYGNIVACSSGQYLNKRTGSCVSCSSDPNSSGVSIQSKYCVCLSNFIWNDDSMKCVACPTNGCRNKEDRYGSGNS